MTGPRDDRFWNRATQTASRGQLDAMHLERIRNLVGWAYEHSPLHRRKYDEAGLKPQDIVTWDDYYHRLPFTDKPDYMQDQEASPDGFGGIALGQEHWQQYFHTTGTTGRFLNEVFTQYELQKSGWQYCYSLWDYGIRKPDSIYFCFNFGMWIGLWSIYWGARNLGLTIVSGGGVTTDERVQQIFDRRPTVVVGTATYLLRLAEVANEQGRSLGDAGVQLLMGGGEQGFSVPVTRQKLADGWGVDYDMIMDCYGIGETMFVGQSCREWGGGVHGVEDIAHSYAVDPETGEPVPDGEVGEHVLTSYTHFTQPFIKYRSHDLVRIDTQPDHGCGWTWKHFPGVVLGRADFMVVIRGVNVYPTAVENLIGEVDGLSHHYELHVTRPQDVDRMEVKVEAADGSADRAALQETLVAHLRRNLGVKLEAEILPPETLPRYELKSKRIFDHRPPEVRPSANLGQ